MVKAIVQGIVLMKEKEVLFFVEWDEESSVFGCRK